MASNTALGCGESAAGICNRKEMSQAVVKPTYVAGIILAGDHAWRNDFWGGVVCRSLLPLAVRPLICHTLEWFRQGGVNTTTICSNGHTKLLFQCLGDGRKLGIALEYYEDRMPRGPAGCVRDAVLCSTASVFVVVDGTIVPQVDLGALVSAHIQSKAGLTVVVEQPHTTLANLDPIVQPVGIYVLSRHVVKQIPAAGYQDIKEVLLPRLYERGEPASAYAVPCGQAPRVTSAASYLAVNMRAVERITQEAASVAGFVRVKEAWVHKSARVDPTARLVGPVLIGAGSSIGPRAMIIAPCTIGPGSTISRNAVISRSAIWNGCTVGEGAIVDGCIMTFGSSVDAGIAVRHTVCVPNPCFRPRWNDYMKSYYWPAEAVSRSLEAGPSVMKHSTSHPDEEAGGATDVTEFLSKPMVSECDRREFSISRA